MKRRLLLTLMLFVLPACVTAQVAPVKAISSAASETTFAVIRLSTKALTPATTKKVETLMGMGKGMGIIDADTLARFRKMFVDAGVENVYLSMDVGVVLFSKNPVAIFPTKSEEAAKKLETALGTMIPARKSVAYKREGAVLYLGPANALEKLNRFATPAENLKAALNAHADAPLQAVIAPLTSVLQKSIEETSPKLPLELGGGSIQVITRGIQWASLAVAPTPDLSANLIVKCADETNATDLRDVIRKGLDLLGKKGSPLRAVLGEETNKLLTSLTPVRKGNRLTVTIQEKDLRGAVAKMANNAQTNAQVAQTMNQLKQMGLAFHTYLNVHRTFPLPHSVDNQKKPLLSWRVHVLPYLEEEELYKKFKLEEPWDSEHNKKLIKEIPKVYQSIFFPKLAKEGKTPFVVPVGASTIFPGGKGLPIAQITDGTSNTAMGLLVDEKSAVIWTKPDDWQFDPDNPTRGLAIVNNRGILVLMADGSVHSLSPKLPKKSFKHLLMRNDGNPLDLRGP